MTSKVTEPRQLDRHDGEESILEPQIHPSWYESESHTHTVETSHQSVKLGKRRYQNKPDIEPSGKNSRVRKKVTPHYGKSELVKTRLIHQSQN